ncbi:MAG: CDP-glucose 4,6-dehydratase [Deltaproteobacteria bacterium]|jgi:CDP-glucose 4,6-dehydratase|nr:CDP-glucose 4,6-dehydratase [Deltaproteobacteria bacterium]
MFEGLYAGRRVFLTGHTGFKGAWLTAWLLDLGAEVTGYSLDIPTSPSAFAQLGLERHIRHLAGDVRDREALARAMALARPEVVFHLAAQSLVRPAYENPGLTFETNALGTLNLLEAVRRAPEVRAVVCVTSDKCYRNDEWVFGYRETDPLGGQDPYSASKACAELVARSYFCSFFANGPAMATARAGNVIGGGDWARDRIIPDCARAWAEGEPALIRNPAATRPWQHVLEPLSGYLWLGARLLHEACPSGASKARGPSGSALDKESFNFGPAAEVLATVAEVTAALGAHWPGFCTRPAPAGETQKQESSLLKLCCDKALALLGWKAVLSFAQAVRLTADWYRAYYEGKSDLRALTGEQIAGYAAGALEKDLPWAR